MHHNDRLQTGASWYDFCREKMAIPPNVWPPPAKAKTFVGFFLYCLNKEEFVHSLSGSGFHPMAMWELQDLISGLTCASILPHSIWLKLLLHFLLGCDHSGSPTVHQSQHLKGEKIFFCLVFFKILMMDSHQG
ncbi:uncharacterized protein LOC124903162 [Homo sapiens]|uniref:uncharacterized protein LOC124903162 n=1 Tax=Homo sapiens TaxID=9606 RepID=UPI0005D01C33|nr:uncharacterized protein LOC124903162 [Homo sapiens]